MAAPADGEYVNGKDGDLMVDSCEVIHFMEWQLDYGPNNDEFFARTGGGAAETTEGPASGSGFFEVGAVRGLTHVLNKIRPGGLYTAIFTHEGAGPTQYTGLIRIGKYSTGANRAGATQRVKIPFTTHGAMVDPGTV